MIVIPTSGRTHRPMTLKSLPEFMHYEVIVVCPKEEISFYRKNFPDVTVEEEPAKGISLVRKFILQDLCSHEKCVLMLDDDLQFYVRRDPWATNLLYSDQRDVLQMLDWLDDKTLSGFAHGGISSREFQNNQLNSEAYNQRVIRAAFFVPQQVNPYLELGRIPVMEDFDVTLQLLRAGFRNVVAYTWAQGQRTTQDEGGCSQYRTHKVQAEAAYLLKELHPEFVTVVEKKNKSGGDFGKRVDVRVKWKKAYESSQVIEA